jgi:hypothetical protein
MKFLLQRVIAALQPAFVQKMGDKPEIDILIKLLNINQNLTTSFKLSICLLSYVRLQVFEKSHDSVPGLNRL